jgi:outer membrane protein OmpA-like peptidoglycan-associated protein
MDKNGFFHFKTLPFIKQHELDLILEEDIELTDFTVLEKGKTITINNIHFESGKSVLMSRSNRELNRLADVLIQNPTMKIKIQGHTDSVGDHQDNQQLSMNRATAVMNYLIENSVNSKQLSAIGFGDSKPIMSNSNEEGRKKNRRVEFLIVE